MIFDEDIMRVIKLAHKYPVISRVGVFGSYARGEQNLGSDIDILFDYSFVDEDSVLEILDYGEELAQGFKKLNIESDYVSYRGVIDAWDAQTKNDILRDVVWVYGVGAEGV